MKIVALRIFSLISVVALLSSCKGVTENPINTVQGPVERSELGVTLTHEHIMSNFGKEIDETAVYDSVKLFKQVIPYLKKLEELGVEAIFDCTTAYFGRRVDLLREISTATGIQIITNTGFYGAADDSYIPKLAYISSAESIAGIWIDEFENGIDDTGIKPGFIKLAFDGGMPTAIDKKLFEAGMLAHLRTGLTLAVHTGENIDAAKYQIARLKEFNVHPGAWIWTHANKVEDDEILIEFATNGAWISLDGVSASNTDAYIQRIKLFKQRQLLDKILLSHDGNGFPRGGEIREFEAMFENLIPEMLKNGFSEDDIHQITVKNPREAFEVKIRNNTTE